MSAVLQFVHQVCYNNGNDDDLFCPGQFTFQRMAPRRSYSSSRIRHSSFVYLQDFVFVWRDINMDRGYNRRFYVGGRSPNSPVPYIHTCRYLLQHHFSRFCMHVDERWNAFEIALGVTPPDQANVHEFVQHWEWDDEEEEEEQQQPQQPPPPPQQQQQYDRDEIREE